QVFVKTTGKWNLKISEHNGATWVDHVSIEAAPDKQNQLSACFYQGDLYFNASFSSLTLNSVTYPAGMHGIFKWDGTAVQFVDSIIGPFGDIYDMDTFNNKLVISGYFTKIGTVNASMLAEYDGSTWQSVGTPANW